MHWLVKQSLGFSSNDGKIGPNFQLEEKIYFFPCGSKIFYAGWKISQFLPSSNNMMQCEESLLELCKVNSAPETSVLRQRSTHIPISISTMLKWSLMALMLFPFVASAQSAQTIDSEAQLASVLCRNPKEEATSGLLLDKNAQLVNVTLWNALINCASSAPREESATKSLEIYKLALRVADRLKKPELVATTYYCLGRTYSRTNDFANSIQAYETSKKLFEQAGLESKLSYVRADLGALYFIMEDYAKAQSYSEQSLTVIEQLKSKPTQESLGPIELARARSLHTLGQIELSNGNHAEALNKLHEALAVLERLNGTKSLYNIPIADVLITIAKVYGEVGEYFRALSYLSKADQVSRSSGDQNTRANIMSGQASVFLEQEDYAVARKYFNASLAIYRSQGNAREEARVLLNLAILQQRQGRDDDALKLFERTLERAKTAKLVDVQIATGVGLGGVLTAKRDFPNALRVINENLELARRVDAKTREAELLWRAAQTYFGMHDYSESAASAEKALMLARSLQLPKLIYLASTTLGEAYAADNKVELAITTLTEAINQIEELRDQVMGRLESRQLFFENKVGPYHTMVKLLTQQGNNFDALLYAERAKGRVLLEGVRNNRRDLRNIPTDEEKGQAELLMNKYLAIKNRIKSQPGAEPPDDLQNELIAVRKELVVFQKGFTAAYPDLLLRVGPARPLTHANLSSLVPTNDLAYLEYVVTGDKVGLFLLKRNGLSPDYELKYVNLSVRADELRRKVNDFHSALAERQPDYTSSGRELYRLLIAPAASELQNIKTICVIPDEFLWTLPFQALTNTRGNYLIQEFSLFYAPSFTVLNEMALRRQQQNSKESLIAFGNPVIGRNGKLKQNLHPLPDAGTEVAAVARAVRTHMKKVLVGREADEKTFKALAPQYATIHLATHGVLDNKDPLNSYLLLTRTDDQTENDGLLRAREIMDLDLDADLAVLSACETGNGRISPGEGVIGMSWAFLVAGARSVVVTHWRVNSAGTARLMEKFYHAMARQSELYGRNKSQALREASLGLLKARRYRHPFYWAGFVLVSGN
ncbi:MAG TPA: CHAT domain-containing tetratricopeptide repeat protein [Pyrinomonadaceae bacterium]